MTRKYNLYTHLESSVDEFTIILMSFKNKLVSLSAVWNTNLYVDLIELLYLQNCLYYNGGWVVIMNVLQLMLMGPRWTNVHEYVMFNM